LIIAKGFIRRTGARGVSIRATAAWALDELYQNWINGKIYELDKIQIDQKLAKR
jgi:error-prone DNA polymerase